MRVTVGGRMATVNGRRVETASAKTEGDLVAECRSYPSSPCPGAHAMGTLSYRGGRAPIPRRRTLVPGALLTPVPLSPHRPARQYLGPRKRSFRWRRHIPVDGARCG
ncbi:hypothetical protein Cde04nite_08560 [Cellulomonas denverensis]|nr:hypothetical protein Cde04nite_08560 [Cellulomonas denverensis]